MSKHIPGRPKNTHCDKCDREVEPINDAVLFAQEAGEFGASFATQSRHFLPVVENGHIICEGSPSRAQYIEGQSRDSRGYPYFPEWEAPLRAAYARLLEKYS